MDTTGALYDSRFNDDAIQSEAGEVEFGNVQAPGWDLRAFGYDYTTNRLVYQGGFNPLAGYQGYGFGSIFIDVSAPPYVGPGNFGTPNANNDYPAGTTFGFDYAIVFTPTTSTTYPAYAVSAAYTIYDLTPKDNVVLSSVFFSSNTEAGPYRYVTGGTVVGSGTATASSYVTGVPLANNGDMQDFSTRNYWLEMDLSSLVAYDNLFEADGTVFHVTQGCGNDMMVGSLTAGVIVPEPSGAIALFGLMAVGVFHRSRRPSKR